MDSISSNIYISTRDFLVSQDKFDLIYDEKLDLLRTSPQPSEAELNQYYESEEYISHTDSRKGLFNFIYQKVKGVNTKRKCKLIQSLLGRSGKILDVGTGTGDFLKQAKISGWATQGTEPNQQAREIAISKGLSITSSLEELKGEKFDVITLWHVLEHVPNLESQIAKLNLLLADNGVLVIAVPNYKAYDAKYYGPYWAAYDVPRHLWHFNKDSFKNLLPKELKPIGVKPMLFDSYYVSLLSEKYKTGKKFSLKGIWIGMKSNWQARRTRQYSSLIYCYRKNVTSQ